MHVSRITLAALWIAMSGCSGRADDAPSACADRATCDVTSHECQRSTFARVACLRGVPIGEPPATATITEADLLAALQMEAASRKPTPHTDAAWRLLGLHLGATNADALEIDLEERSKLVGAYYDPSTKGVTLVVHPAPLDAITAQRVLAHEYVHAQQDGERDLGAFEKAHSPSTDAFLGAISVIEGEARLYELLFDAQQKNESPGSLDWATFFATSELAVWKAAADKTLPIDEALQLFPYAWGGARAHDRWASGGSGAVRGTFEDVPPATASLLFPSMTVDPFVFPKLDPAVPSGFAFVSDDTLGALAVFGFLSRVGGAPIDAQTWRGDRLEVYGDDASGETVAVWRLAFGDAATALQVEKNLGPSASLPAAGSRARAQGVNVMLVVTDAPGALQPWLDALGGF